MEFMDQYGELIGTASLVFFFLFFVGVIAWVFRPGSKEKYRNWGKIPLKYDRKAKD